MKAIIWLLAWESFGGSGKVSAGYRFVKLKLAIMVICATALDVRAQRPELSRKKQPVMSRHVSPSEFQSISSRQQPSSHLRLGAGQL